MAQLEGGWCSSSGCGPGADKADKDIREASFFPSGQPVVTGSALSAAIRRMTNSLQTRICIELQKLNAERSYADFRQVHPSFVRRSTEIPKTPDQELLVILSDISSAFSTLTVLGRPVDFNIFPFLLEVWQCEEVFTQFNWALHLQSLHNLRGLEALLLEALLIGQDFTNGRQVIS